MYLDDTSFDAVITDKNGLTLEVDCRVTEPAASGLPASISIEVPLSDKETPDIENPCSLRSLGGPLEVQIEDLSYRSMPSGATRRKHARGVFHIHHAGRLWVRATHWSSERPLLRFLLSPVRFFKESVRSEVVNYAATPDMAVELFKLQVADLGEVRFIKFWTVHRIDEKGVAAELRFSYAAEIRYGLLPVRWTPTKASRAFSNSIGLT